MPNRLYAGLIVANCKTKGICTPLKFKKGSMSKKPTWPVDRIEYIDHLTFKDLAKLVDKKILTIDDPIGPLKVRIVQEFLSRNPGFYAHGFAVSADDASDHKDHVVIEGVEGDIKTIAEMLDFLQVFWNATELDVEAKHCYAWFNGA